MPEAVKFQHFEVARKDDGSLHELGRGAMGITYKAFDTNLRCFVALKVINSAYLNSDIARQRFLREARAAAALRHPNVATVFHLGSEEDNYFYAMEFIDGDTVEGFMKREGAIPRAMALEIAAQVAKALGAAEKQGLVHRDIKPSNLMFVREDGGEFTVKVIDFGLAKSSSTGEDTASLTGGGFLGTPHFASPEQLEERELDVRSDIYSLGVTLWYMLAGKTPFSGSLAQVMSQHLHREPPFETLEGQPPAVLALLRRMMAKDAKDRPQTPAELRREIEACAVQVRALAAAAPAAVSDEVFETAVAPDPVAGSAVELAPGAVLATRFRLIGETTASDHGRVFRAERLEDAAAVALLILNPGLLTTSEAFTRLEREVECLQKLRHPAFQSILSLEHGNHHTFLVLEWLEGPSLLDVLRTRRALPPAEVSAILAPLADAFDELAAAGLSCPDIGAHAIVLPGADPARPVEAWKDCPPKFLPLTASGVGSGSPDATLVASSFALMKASGAFAADPSTAYVFAVAALAYEALGGVRVGSSGGYVPIPGLSESGNAALRRALNPSQGFPSARTFLNELASEPGLPKAPAFPPPSPPVLPAAPARAPSPVPPSLPAVKNRRSPVLAISFAAVVLALAGIAVIAVGTRKKPPKPVQVTQATPVPASKTSPTPEPTPTPVDPQVQAFQDAMAAADALEKQDQVGAAIAAYAAAAGKFPNEKEPHVALEKMTAALRARSKKLSPSELVALRQPLEEAAALDVMSAQMLLGEMLQRSDPGDSLKWFMAAGNHHRQTEAMVQSGLMLSNGLGVAAPDPAGAVEWFKKAVDNGSTDGMVALAECYMGLIPGTPIDRKRAIELLASASAFHNIRALNMLGDIYRRGEPGLIEPPDPRKALELHTQARDLGSPDAYGYLGVLYFTGQGMERPDKNAGCEMMRQGAEKGSSMSMAFYAQCLQDGDGVEKDPAAAREWYIKAARGGNRAAIAWCKKNNIPLANSP